MGKTILTAGQTKLLDCAAAAEVINRNFYLTGGTALAHFYLHHRISEDLDFFSEWELDEPQLHAWVKATARTCDVDVTFQTLRGQLVYYFHFPQEVIKTDFAYFPFSMLGEGTKYKGLRVSSIEDIAVNKIQAILTRSRGRDYVDLYEIIRQQRLRLDQLIKNYRLKFDVTIPPEQLAKRLTAVVDASDQPRFLGAAEWETVETFFLEEAKKLKPLIVS